MNLYSSIGILLIGMLFVTCLKSQNAAFNGGAAWNSSSGGMLSTMQGIHGVYGNNASLADSDKKWGLDVGVEKRYNLDQLATLSIGGYYTMEKSAFTLSMVRFGYEDYAEQKVNLGYTRKLFAGFNLGGNFTYLQYRLNEFGTKNLFSFDVGLKAEVTKSLSVSTYINNPASLKFNDNIDIPVRLATGVNYHPSTKVQWMAEIEKIIESEITIKSAIVYFPIESVSLRIGADLTRNFVGFGFGYNFNGFAINGAYTLNQVLGNNPALSLSYEQSK